jgi:hypothetical protein
MLSSTDEGGAAAAHLAESSPEAVDKVTRGAKFAHQDGSGHDGSGAKSSKRQDRFSSTFAICIFGQETGEYRIDKAGTTYSAPTASTACQHDYLAATAAADRRAADDTA